VIDLRLKDRSVNNTRATSTPGSSVEKGSLKSSEGVRESSSERRVGEEAKGERGGI